MLRNLLFFLLLILLVGCQSPLGLYRTQVSKWEHVSYPGIGIQLDVPKDDWHALISRKVVGFSTNAAFATKYACKSVSINFHPIYFGIPDDAQYLMKVSLVVVPRDAREMFVAGPHYGGWLFLPSFASRNFVTV